MLAYGVDEEGGEGHEDGDDDEGDLEDLLDDFFTLDTGQAVLLEEAGAVFLMMMVVMCFGHVRWMRVKGNLWLRVSG